MLEFGPWDLLPIKVRQKVKGNLHSKVFLPRSRGQGGLEPEDAFLAVLSEAELENPTTRAPIIRTLLAFVRSHGLHKGWDYEGAIQDAALCAAFLDRKAEAAGSWLRRHHIDADVESIPALTEVLLVGARALGVAGALSRKLSDRVAALFGNVDPIDEPQHIRWAQEVHRFAEHRPVLQGLLLEQVGARQGGAAGVHAVDVAVLESTIQEVAKSWLIRSSVSVGSREVPAVKAAFGALRALRQDLERTLRQRRRELLDWRERATAWFGEDLEKQELQQVLRETIRTALKVLPLSFDPSNSRNHINKLNDISLKTTLAACARLADSEEPADILTVLAGRPDPVIRWSEALMTEFDRFLDLYSKELATRREQGGENPAAEASQAVLQEVYELEKLLRDVEGNRA